MHSEFALQLQIQRFTVQILLMCTAGLWDPTLLQGSRSPFDQKATITIFKYARLTPCQCDGPKLALGQPKNVIKNDKIVV